MLYIEKQFRANLTKKIHFLSATRVGFSFKLLMEMTATKNVFILNDDELNKLGGMIVCNVKLFLTDIS